jgi:hypothetical protein
MSRRGQQSEGFAIRIDGIILLICTSHLVLLNYEGDLDGRASGTLKPEFTVALASLTVCLACLTLYLAERAGERSRRTRRSSREPGRDARRQWIASPHRT